MLTNNEKKWLADRQCVTIFSCLHCDKHGNQLCPLKYVDGYCMKKSDYQDAAEFEARVAMKLSDSEYHNSDEYTNGYFTWLHFTTNAERLKIARIEVEEELTNVKY